jgi:hypothetical protein
MTTPEYARANFNTLLRAAAAGDLALLDCADAVTGEPRYVICAIARAGAGYAITPSRAWQSLRGLQAAGNLFGFRPASARRRVRAGPGRV